MKILTRADAARFLLEHDHFAILSHRRPDGDTVGSSAALCRGLRQLGKTAHVLVNKEVTPRFAWLHEGLTKPWVEEGDTIVSVDVASPEMLPADFRPLLGKIALRIDHHSSATSFTEQELVDGDSASCAEVVWDVLELMGVKADRALAEAVYVGVSTDTGCFRFSNTTAHTFSVAALCTRAGARIYELNQELFETNTLERLKMQAWIVEHLELLRGGEMAICAIPVPWRRRSASTRTIWTTSPISPARWRASAWRRPSGRRRMGRRSCPSGQSPAATPRQSPSVSAAAATRARQARP